VRYGRRPQGRAGGGGSRRHRTRWRDVLWPLVAGLVLCARALWAGLTYRNNQAAFRARAVSAKAVIDQIYGGPLQLPLSGGPASFNQYGLVHFAAQGQTAHARVLLSYCTGTCFPVYRVGQVLTVYYSPQNLSYAQLGSPTHQNSADDLYAGVFFGLLGLAFLAAAVINVVTVLGDARLASVPRTSTRHPG
jgi:hypothetical protein